MKRNLSVYEGEDGGVDTDEPKPPVPPIIKKP